MLAERKKIKSFHGFVSKSLTSCGVISAASAFEKKVLRTDVPIINLTIVG